MQTFTDCLGQQWDVALTAKKLVQIESRLPCRIEVTCNPYEQFSVGQCIKIMAILTEESREAKKIPEDDFIESHVGSKVDEVCFLVCEELRNFTQAFNTRMKPVMKQWEDEREAESTNTN